MTYHSRVPRSIRKNLRFRRRILERCAADPAAQRAMMEACRHDPLFWANVFGWTYDPRLRSKTVPFVAWAIQDKAIALILSSIDDGEDVLIEKSRDMGASWINLFVLAYLCIFRKGYTFLLLSRKEKLVDSPGDPDSLFWKLDFIFKMLPDWMRPELNRTKLHYDFPRTGCTIDGDATTDAASVGGRRSAIFIDEFSRFENGHLIDAGSADTTDCRIFNFTPFGSNNAAYKLTKRPDIRRLRMHWKDDPRKNPGLYRYDPRTRQLEIIDKNYPFARDYDFMTDGRFEYGSPWFDRQRRRRANDRNVAEMLDIDYQGSAYQFFDKPTVVALQEEYARAPWFEGDIDFDPDTGNPRGLVRVAGGPLKVWGPLDAHFRPLADVYVAGCDLSAGTGATNSCCSIGSATTFEKVAEYATPYYDGTQFAKRVAALGRLFKSKDGLDMMVCWEHVGPGHAFAKEMLSLRYRRLYYREANLMGGGKITKEPGWFPSNDNKRLLLTEYRTALSTRQFINRSRVALDECLCFQHTTKGTIEHEAEATDDPTGARDNHGDRVIADAQVWKLMKIYERAEPAEATGVIPVNSLAGRRQMAHNAAKAAAEY